MSFLKRFGWVVPTSALAVGALALIPGALASTTGADLPTADTVAVSTTQFAGEAVAVDARNWDEMRRKGLRSKPIPRTFRTPSGNIIVTGTGVLPGTNPAGNP